MNLTHCENEEMFLCLHVRNLCIQQCILSTIVCSDMFSLFLLIGNSDLIKNFWHTCVGAPKVWGLCSAEHVRTFLSLILHLCYLWLRLIE